MFNSEILKPEIQKYLRKNYRKDIPSLIFKGSPFAEVTVQELAVQLKGLNVAEKKFPRLFNTEGIVYPPKLNLEQTSSETTAIYKSQLISGDSGIDLTGGLGIDTYFLSRNFKEFEYCELNGELADIAGHNFRKLKAENIQVHHTNGLERIENSETGYDWVYADPARRDNLGGKVFKLEDCEPDIPGNLEKIFNKSGNILIKTSPILDITAGLNEMAHVKEIHIVSVRNEVKELLWIMEKDYRGAIQIKTVNFEKKGIQRFSSVLELQSQVADYSLPQDFLYEPNAAIMKSGLFDNLAHLTKTKKLHTHSHLYTSEKHLEFPGRIFYVFDIMKYGSPGLKKSLKSKKANVSTRNFPESVETIRKKFRIKDGGEVYVFFTTNMKEEKIAIFCKKV